MASEEDPCDTLKLKGTPVSELKVTDIKRELEKRGLSKSGSKTQLTDRLKAQLLLEKLQQDAAQSSGDELEGKVPNMALQQDDKAGQSEFVRQYLEQQQRNLEIQMEVKKQVEEERKRKSADESSADEASTPQVGSQASDNPDVTSPKKFKDDTSNAPAKEISKMPRPARKSSRNASKGENGQEVEQAKERSRSPTPDNERIRERTRSGSSSSSRSPTPEKSLSRRGRPARGRAKRGGGRRGGRKARKESRSSSPSSSPEEMMPKKRQQRSTNSISSRSRSKSPQKVSPEVPTRRSSRRTSSAPKPTPDQAEEMPDTGGGLKPGQADGDVEDSIEGTPTGRLKKKPSSEMKSVDEKSVIEANVTKPEETFEKGELASPVSESTATQVQQSAHDSQKPDTVSNDDLKGNDVNCVDVKEMVNAPIENTAQGTQTKTAETEKIEAETPSVSEDKSRTEDKPTGSRLSRWKTSRSRSSVSGKSETPQDPEVPVVSEKVDRKEGTNSQEANSDSGTQLQAGLSSAAVVEGKNVTSSKEHAGDAQENLEPSVPSTQCRPSNVTDQIMETNQPISAEEADVTSKKQIELQGQPVRIDEDISEDKNTTATSQSHDHTSPKHNSEQRRSSSSSSSSKSPSPKKGKKSGSSSSRSRSRSTSSSSSDAAPVTKSSTVRRVISQAKDRLAGSHSRSPSPQRRVVVTAESQMEEDQPNLQDKELRSDSHDVTLRLQQSTQSDSKPRSNPQGDSPSPSGQAQEQKPEEGQRTVEVTATGDTGDKDTELLHQSTADQESSNVGEAGDHCQLKKEKGTRKRKWGSKTSKASKTSKRTSSMEISSDSLKNLIGDVKLTETVFDMETEVINTLDYDEQEEDRRDVKVKRTVAQSPSHSEETQVEMPIEHEDARKVEAREEQEETVEQDQSETAEAEKKVIRVSAAEPRSGKSKLKEGKKVKEKKKKEITTEKENKNTNKATAETEEKEKIFATSRPTKPLLPVVDEPEPVKGRQSPAYNPPDRVIRIAGLVRPFTVGQLKELLRRTGELDEEYFWISDIKSHCLAAYKTEEEAVRTRAALHGTRWPQSNPKILIVDYASVEDVEHRKKAGDVPLPELKRRESVEQRKQKERKEDEEKERRLKAREQRDKEREEKGKEVRDKREVRERERKREPDRKNPVREWDRDKVQQLSRSRSRSRERERSGRGSRAGARDESKRREHSKDKKEEDRRKEKKQKESKMEEEPPAKLLDDLFRKTKATPCIYWLPLTEEQAQQRAVKRQEQEKERQKRLAAAEEREKEELKKREAARLERQRERERERGRGRTKERDRGGERSRQERSRSSRSGSRSRSRRRR